jgi:anaerobic magnesium-protoporphyrin IX monomethyl ester cyclase
VKWRYRDPVKLADEIEWLYRTHDVRFITLADENPTTRVDVWRQFLEELARRKLPVKLFATIRATDIVRDADLLPLYRAAGILYVLMGIESTRDDVLADVRKGSSTRHDFLACQLLKQNGIFSILGHIVGLRDDETWRTFRESLRNLMRYDGDYLNAMYVTPHDWTPMGLAALATQRVVEPDLSRWDYRHQVLAQRHMTPWQVLLAVKWMELRFHLRPSRIRRILFMRDRATRKQLWWTARHTGMVWLAELVAFFVRAILRKSQVQMRGKRSDGGTASEAPRSTGINLPVVASG